jgi:predicted transcriptional regulator
MDKKQKEAHVLALYEKGKTYREITKEAGVSPNTIKAIVNKAGLDQMTSISSRVFELYSQQKTPLQVAITLGLKSEEAIRYHQEYFMLLGLTEFTKIYLQIKDNPWPYVNLARLVHNAKMGDGEVVELLKIANGYLPRVRLEYDRVEEELNSRIAELNSLKAEVNNSVRIYQQFCDRNLELNKREDELLSKNWRPQRWNCKRLCSHLNFMKASQTTTISTMKMECLIVHLFHLYLMIRTINILLFNVNLQKLSKRRKGI